MEISRRASLQHQELSSQKTGEKYSLSAVLSEQLKVSDLFIHHEIIAPGRRSSVPHFHRSVDEIAIVLKGRATFREGDQVLEGSPGDIASFLANSGAMHFIANETDSDVEVLIVSRRSTSPDVATEAR